MLNVGVILVHFLWRGHSNTPDIIHLVRLVKTIWKPHSIIMRKFPDLWAEVKMSITLPRLGYLKKLVWKKKTML